MNWHTIVFAAAGYVAAFATLRVGVVRPLAKLLRRLEELLEMPEAVRELTSTVLRYIQDNEHRLSRVEQGLSLVARTLRLHLDFGPREDGPK